MKTLAKIIKIKIFRTLKINEKRGEIQGAFIFIKKSDRKEKRKSTEFHKNN